MYGVYESDTGAYVRVFENELDAADWIDNQTDGWYRFDYRKV